MSQDPAKKYSTLENLEVKLSLTYNWGYEKTRQDLRDLYKKAQRNQWNPDDTLPWHLDVDLEKPEFPAEMFALYGTELWDKMTPKERIDAQIETFSWTTSQFLHGEQGALMAAAQLVTC